MCLCKGSLLYVVLEQGSPRQESLGKEVLNDCAIEESNNVETLSIDDLQGSLHVHEQKMKPIKYEDQVLKVSYGDKGAGRWKGRGVKGGQGRDSANYADYDDSEEVLLMAFDTPSQSYPKNKIWYFDSGCSNHMCGIKEWFYDFDTKFRETVRLGDNSQMNVMGKGNVKLQLNAVIQVITVVYYIPE
ncbi:retrovirus-related pol polyprotein from transposon TNT 1-94 [Trifolium medium]|uniref:Retrovirus-related pol polyprotein from transposon TNT 1-94 n=1 Tax=Trifolium medium TaxID=97028 RepID=A0A392MH47_9FABA|nr:retrovirus-related pol polyprotein from transposon TNT 1-94 [Trifolium medium]